MEDPVLLLNASWEPICVVPMRRAVVLVLTDKAEVIQERDYEIRSSSTSIDAPSVIRLTRYVNVPRFRRAYLSRRNVLARDKSICAYCEGKANTMDHVLPKSRGGRHCWENVVACCFACNQKKDDRTPEEMGWKCKNKAYEPQGALRLSALVAMTQEDWSEWIPA